MEQIYLDTARILKAISDPKRLKIVDMLSCKEQCAIMGEICQKKMHCIREHGRHEEQGMMENPEAKNDVREITE